MQRQVQENSLQPIDKNPLRSQEILRKAKFDRKVTAEKIELTTVICRV